MVLQTKGRADQDCLNVRTRRESFDISILSRLCKRVQRMKFGQLVRVVHGDRRVDLKNERGM